MYQFKWLIKRFGFSKRIIVEFLNKLIYQKNSQFLLHSWNAHKTPYEPMLFYNFFGRILWAGKQFLFKDGIKLEGYDTSADKLDELYLQGSHKVLWPKSPMIGVTKYQLDDSYAKKIEKSLNFAYKKEADSFDKTKEWQRIASLITEHFFDKDGHLIQEHLVNYRKDSKLYQKLFNDQFNYLNLEDGYIKSYLNSIDLILEYHRISSKVDKNILSNLSESDAGNNLCAVYRGKRVSQKSIFHAVVVNDLIKHIPFSSYDRAVVLDIGSGYGGLSRLLDYYTSNSCHILLDLPETLILTSYFIKYNFPDRKIALLEDIINSLDDFDRLIQEYDFIIIPPSVLKNLKNLSVDVVINTASMGFMQEEYLEFYLTQIDRVLKEGGYFYSINKDYDDHWGIGYYNWDFKATYLTILFEFNNRFSYPQWLGQKVKR